MEAIRLVKQLEAEGRYATEAEQVILSKYVGWGGLSNAFDARKADWAKEYAELKELMTEEEITATGLLGGFPRDLLGHFLMKCLGRRGASLLGQSIISS